MPTVPEGCCRTSAEKKKEQRLVVDDVSLRGGRELATGELDDDLREHRPTWVFGVKTPKHPNFTAD